MTIALARAPSAAHPRVAPLVPLLVALLCFVLGVDQILLWLFLGLLPSDVFALAMLLVAFPAIMLARDHPPCGPVALRTRTILVGAIIAAVVFLLGGEGRLFYAHPDWQVRFAVLRDLTLHPWPFVYQVRPVPDLLRAPLGMYLAPALIGKALGYRVAEWALFGQNAAILTLIFVLGAQIFASNRSRLIGVGIFLGFSGMDLVGQILAGQPPQLTSERWNVAVFSSTMTQAFAVPQHGMAGWIGAMLFLLWRDRRLSLAGFLTPVPFLALWSPFAVMGIAPFVALAGVTSLRRGTLRLRDVVLPAVTLVIAAPGLLYLLSGSGAVGGGGARIGLSQYLIFEALEVGPYLMALAYIGWRGRFGGATLAVTAATLLVAPLIQVGTSNDFVMRASIPALAILSVMLADALARPVEPGRGLWVGVAVGAFAIGLATPAFEIVRALLYPAAPEMRCSYFGVVPGGYDTYVTPLPRVQRWIAPVSPTRFHPADPARCWSGKWPNPLYRDFPERVAPEDRDERL